MRRPLAFLLLAGLATAGLVVAGVLVLGGDDDADPPAGKAPFETTPLSEVDTTGLVFTRGPFCEAIDPRQVAAVLGGAPTGSRSWQSGDPVPVGAKQDVGHEFGCEYTGADGTVARAWVFAPPVTPEEAAALTEDTVFGWCAASPAEFGVAGSQLACLDQDGDGVAYRGLLGDAWLTCEVVVPATGTEDPPVDRAGRWCAGVLDARDG